MRGKKAIPYFSLADQELYKAAYKDDPATLLKGVAIAGLVGILHQLGDLAESVYLLLHLLASFVLISGHLK